MKKIILLFVMFLLVSFFTVVYAGAPDGSGPWADSVVSSSQANTKGGTPVSVVNPARSNPTSAVGVAENDTQDDHFFSLGFGGSITLRFDNGVRDGVLIVESTNPGYAVEKAKVEVSADGASWTFAGSVSQDGQVTMPENVACVNYVRITDISNKDDFSEDTADAYDVDGVQAINSESCGGSGGENPTGTPTPSPTPSKIVTPTPTPSSNTNDHHDDSQPKNDSKPKECTQTKPGTPSITSIERTSGTTVKLTWSAVTPVTTYAISYGLSAGSYQFGVPSTGNVTSFTVGGLDSNTRYYFSVRAINDCMPGDGSDEQTTGGSVLGASTGGQVLGASTDVLAATGSQTERTAVLSGIAAFSITLLAMTLGYRKFKV